MITTIIVIVIRNCDTHLTKNIKTPTINDMNATKGNTVGKDDCNRIEFIIFYFNHNTLSMVDNATK
jgi:hypothetical protein